MMSFSKNAHLLLILFWLFIVVSFCASHLTNDFLVFIAWGRSVAQNESFDFTSFTQLWEIKGYFSRVLYFLLYSVSAIFVEDVGLKFQIIYKIVGCVAINAIIGLSIWSLPKDYATAKKNCFWFFSAALLSLHFSCHLQPEFWAVAFLSLSLALYLRKSICWSLLAGFVLGLTFFLKSPIPLMGGSLFAISLLLKRTSLGKEIRDILPLGLAMLLTILSGYFVMKAFNPQEIQDILDASYYQNTLFADPRSVIHGVKMLVMGVLRNVWTNLGLLCFLSCFVYLFVRKKISIRDAVIIVGSFLFPIMYVLISNCFFVYHYTLFLFPFFGVVLFVLKDESLWTDLLNALSSKKMFSCAFVVAFYVLQFIPLEIKSRDELWMLLAFLLIGLLFYRKWNNVILVIFLSSAFGVYLSNSSIISSYIQRANMAFDENEKENDLHLKSNAVSNFENDKVLYLDAGTGLYYCRKPSYLRYFYPLPIQRINESESSFIYSDTFRETKTKILNYKGDFLTLDSTWFFKHSHDDIKGFISLFDRYDVIPSVAFSWDLYPKEPVKIDSIVVMRRKI